jgi:outer membrane receptor protein involved in Fe transport
MGGSGISINQFPGNAEVLNTNDFSRDSQTLPELLDQRIGSMQLNDTQGNPYQVDLNYRGFTASPILGTSQGLSLFLDGVRMNEPFGDVISWDLIPQIAVSEISLIPGSNPVYGFNTLGGALALETKSGFSYQGNEIKTTVGSFRRQSIDAQIGRNDGEYAYYIGMSSLNDDGWAQYNPSQIRQFFGKLSRRGESLGMDLSMVYSESSMNGNQTIPLSMINQASSSYSHPDYVQSKHLMLHLKTSLEIDAMNSIETALYYRNIKRDIFNSNIHDLISNANNTDECVPNCPAANYLTNYSQYVVGANWEWSNKDPMLNMNQIMTIGGNLEWSNTSLTNTAKYAYVDAQNHGTISLGDSLTQSTIFSTTKRLGIFISELVNVSERFSILASARYDMAQINLSGTSCTDSTLCTSLSNISATPGSNTATDVSGTHQFQRLNPAFGITYLLDTNLTGFINYSEGIRIPSAIEFACSDPTNPCSGVPNAFASDPELKPVISKTYELGLRGKLAENWNWKATYFLSNLYDDILFNQANATQGYFSNVGQTRREGLELSSNGKYKNLDFAVSGSYLIATFQTPFNIANTNNSQCINNNCSEVMTQVGNRIPGIPNWVFKTRLGYQVNEQFHVGTTILAQGPSFARGDENNQDINGQVPGFFTIKLDGDYRLSKDFSLFTGVYNLLNRQYSNFGMLAMNNITSGTSEQFRSIAAPRTWFIGLRGSF